jgi:hypothetical protein
VITTFAVGAELKLIDQFSPALRKLLAEIRQLNVQLDKARENLATIGRGVTAGLGGAQSERRKPSRPPGEKLPRRLRWPPATLPRLLA